MALSRDRHTPQRTGDEVAHPVKGGVRLYAGALVVLEAGYAAPGREASGLIAVGRSEKRTDNTTGQDGDLTVEIRTGTFRFANDSVDPVTQADCGSACFVVDDETVSASDSGGARSVAGRIIELENAGVWVQVGPVS